MCDYSLAYFPNRLARNGEELVAHRFATQTMGFASVHRSWKEILLPAAVAAVCVPPGAKLLLCDIPVSIQEQLGVAAIEEVIFTQKSAESFMYRDAVRFANGQEILIQCLRRGQRVQVLSLADEEDEHESKNGTSVSAAHW